MHKHRPSPTVAEKWGFGMAPPKAVTQSDRKAACRHLLEILSSRHLPNSNERCLHLLSTTKGLFNRVVREDQWDWFTVCGQLGYPSRRLSMDISDGIRLLRSAIKEQNRVAFDRAHTKLCRLPTRACICVMIGRGSVPDEPDAGWIYVLSTREWPALLKIGMTTRTVERRAREINNATGVAIPFGVRRCWRVADPGRAERLVHGALQRYRLREDREFFKVSFGVASQSIEAAIRDGSLELRTVYALGGLDHESYSVRSMDL